MSQQAQSIFHWVIRIIVAVIMLQTLFFKFSGSEESVYIFSQMGIEPWGRYATGIAELIASVLILYKPATFMGALMALGIMSGAVLSHLFVLGIEVKNDGGLLFAYALVVLAGSLLLLWLNKQQLTVFLGKIQKKSRP